MRTRLAVLSRPQLFEDRTCYRILGAGTPPDGASLEFGEGRYFQMINTCEAAAHEYAAATLAGDHPALADLPLRSAIGDPTDLRRRPAMSAIGTLTLRADRAAGDAAMILHWRDPARVATGGGLYQVAPVGMFQPSHDAGWNLANDFSLWRAIVREMAEELLGGGEDYHSDAAPIDYERWPLQITLAAARRAGTLRLHWLGLGLDPLTLVVDMLSVAVFDAPVFDAVFAGLVQANDEGHLVASEDPAGTDRRPPVHRRGRRAVHHRRADAAGRGRDAAQRVGLPGHAPRGLSTQPRACRSSARRNCGTNATAAASATSAPLR